MNSHFFSVCKSDKCTVDTKIHEFTSSNLNFVRYYFPMETKCTITKQIMEILLTFDCSCTRCASGSNTTEARLAQMCSAVREHTNTKYESTRQYACMSLSTPSTGGKKILKVSKVAHTVDECDTKLMCVSRRTLN